MTDKYEEIKKLLINDIKNAQDITARSIAIQTFVSFCKMAYHYGDDSPNECSEDDTKC